MKSRSRTVLARRAFLRFAASSPVLAAETGFVASLLGGPAFAQESATLDDPELALNVFDFQEHAKATMPPWHYAYMAQGADDGRMLEVNREGFQRYKLRARRLSGVRDPDTSVELFGHRYDCPIFIAPCGALATFHPEGELAVARAAKAHNALQILSTVTNYSVEDVAAAREAPVWFQLYPTSEWETTRRIIARAENAGSSALVLTVDIPSRNLEPIARFRRDTNPICQACHAPGVEAAFARKAMFDGIDVASMRMGVAGLTWDYVARLKDATSMRVLVKGVVTAEDAERCLRQGADGIIVSNHGSRAEDSGRSSIECLPEVVAAAGRRVPVLVDSGFRRGTDIYKALALGATGIGIGKPYLWGLGGFGQPGVERILAILERELRIVMTQMGSPDLASIGRESIDV